MNVVHYVKNVFKILIAEGENKDDKGKYYQERTSVSTDIKFCIFV